MHKIELKDHWGQSCYFHLLLCLSLGRGSFPAKTPASFHLCPDPDTLGGSPIRKSVENDDTGAGTVRRSLLANWQCWRNKEGVKAMQLFCSGHHCGQGGKEEDYCPSLMLARLRYKSKCVNTLKSMRLNHNVGSVLHKKKTLQQHRGKQSWVWWFPL